MNTLFPHSHEHPQSPAPEKREASGGPVPFTIAVSGKGGTGKTTLASLLIRELAAAGQVPVLAVDADPNANLHEALGMELTETLGGMREEAFSRRIPPGMGRREYLAFRFNQVIAEDTEIDLVAMGRPEGQGCYCFANDVLRECMAQLARHYPFIVIDTEAGLEHISRGTAGHPDLLLVVSDPGARGLRTIGRIRATAVQLGLEGERILTVVNRFRDGMAPVESAAPFGIIPFDPAIESADLRGTPVSRIPKDSPARAAVREMTGKIRAMAGRRAA